RAHMGAVLGFALCLSTTDLPADQPPPRLRRSAEPLRAKAEAGRHKSALPCVASICTHHLVASALRRKMIPLLLLFATCCAGIETTTGVYATVGEARAAGAIERGFVPEGLPASVTGLRLYRSRDNRLTYAVNWRQGRAFYWR